MSKLRRSMFATITLTLLERLFPKSAGQVLSGKGTSSHDKKANKQGASQMRPMQALVKHGFKTRKPERLTRMTIHNIHKVPAIVPAKSPGKRTAQFKPMTLNSSSNCIPVCNWVVMYDFRSNNPHAISILCQSTGIYHNVCLEEDGQM